MKLRKDLSCLIILTEYVINNYLMECSFAKGGEMITIFNRAKLFADTNAEAAAGVWSALKENGIEYTMLTKQNVSTLRKNVQNSYGMSKYSGFGGMPASNFADTLNYLYIIYVKKKDLARAKEVCHL